MSYAEIYRAPGCLMPLSLSDDWRELRAERVRYPIVDNVPDFLGGVEQGALNDKYMRFYDKVSLFYKIGAVLSFAVSKKWSEELLGDLEIKAGDHVLETSVGTGNNLRYLARRYPDAVYYGMDISGGMLRECKKNLKKWDLPAHLARANAQSLPYPDNRFDVVFHIGGINFFDDKRAAVEEMVRVAKPGSHIVIIDETEKWVRKVYQRMPVVSGYYEGMDQEDMTGAPVDLLPRNVERVKSEIIWKGGMYKLSCHKKA